MAQHLLISLLLCTLWSAALWATAKPLLKRNHALQQWPVLYWWLLALSFLPLLPLPELYQHWTIPSVLLQDTQLLLCFFTHANSPAEAFGRFVGFFGRQFNQRIKCGGSSHDHSDYIFEDARSITRIER